MKTIINMFKCNCKNIEVGSYSNQMWVHAPAHMSKVNGYCLDRCIAEEVMILWQLGITTTGCCCGHGKAPPFIGVYLADTDRMKAMGYLVIPNNCRPGDDDSFMPMGADHPTKYLKDKLNVH